jgi:hypothetical protein
VLAAQRRGVQVLVDVPVAQVVFGIPAADPVSLAPAHFLAVRVAGECIEEEAAARQFIIQGEAARVAIAGLDPVAKIQVIDCDDGALIAFPRENVAGIQDVRTPVGALKAAGADHAQAIPEKPVAGREAALELPVSAFVIVVTGLQANVALQAGLGLSRDQVDRTADSIAV